MTPDQYCQERAAKSGSSFYYSFLFLPPDQRRAITALYAFCREVDDIVDECSDPALARTKLAWWRTEIAAAFSGEPQHPVARALAPVVRRHSLPEQRFHEIIDGMEMDLSQNRYRDFDALRVYCHRVAGVVGLMAAQIFGYRDPATLHYAEELGIAFQLTNIVRDIGEDARRDRIYVPEDDLARFGVSAADLLQRRETDAVHRLLAFEIGRAREHYERAMARLPKEDRRNQRPGLVMAAIYRAILDEIETSGFRVLNSRIGLTPIRKLWIAWRTWTTA